ncbi:MAG: adenylate/guanylate cyclase domain-containing protein, partial [bacterium]|nr:adenylate/guanylate cyclase domain-containing protein [bacterium]
MTEKTSSGRLRFFRSIVFKNILLFLLILLVAVVPLAFYYYQDSRDYEIKVLASRLEFFAERGASWLDPKRIHALRTPADQQTKNYLDTVQALSRIEKEFKVDNAIVMRREADGQYTYIAVGGDVSGAVQPDDSTVRNPCSPTGRAGQNPCNPTTAAGSAIKNPCAPTATRVSIFDIGKPVHIHPDFPATYKATNDTWLAGEMMHSQLFGGRVGDQVFDQFLQINTPLKLNGKVVAILMLNKFANPVAAAVQAKTFKVFGLTVVIVAVGLVLFGYASARMLRPLKNLTGSAGEVAQGNLDITIAPPRSQDEVGRLTATFGTMLEGLRQRDFIRDTFGRYISQEVVDELLSSPDGLKLGGELREVTFLVSDLRGFTALSSRREPGEVIQIVNRFLEPMVDTITHYQGTVDEFQGDGILAFFGAPLASSNDPVRAVACAVAMQRALVEINTEQRRRGLPELHMGIGINTGEVIVGNIGSEKRTKYGALGTPINMAYRIESHTVSGQVLISPSTYEQ